MRFHRGKALYDLADLKASVKELKASVRLEPSNAEAHLLLGMAYFTRGDRGDESFSVWDKCAKSLEKAIPRS